MTPFRDQPIARKALILGLVPTVCALIIASAAFLISTFVSIRRSAIDDITTSAAVIADSVNVALSFNDAQTAAELAGALREKHNIDRVCIFDGEGRYFAGYAAPGQSCPPAIDPPVEPRASQVVALHPVVVGSRRVGTVRVIGNLAQLYATLATQATVTAIALAAAVGAALLLIGRLQRSISNPVAELAATADRVSRSGDYSLRATQTTNDEVGRLVQSFNGMLGAVQRSQEERSLILEREREASRLKDEFLATVSHELRTPLNAILGWTHVLTTTQPSPDTLDKGLKTLHRNAKAQTRLIEDLIEVSRIATGKLNLKLEVVDFRDAVRQTAEALQAGAAAKSVSLEFSVPPSPALVSGDRDRIQQIVTNLVSNAVKFTPAGGAVRIALVPSARSFVLRVRDTGDGIAPEFLPHVFERFRQADGSTTREHGGLGLGLAIVNELVQLHHGSVTATSGGRGQGAEFVVRLPRLDGTVSMAHDREESSAGTQLPGVRVMAVDDNLDALEVLMATLADAGAEVRIAISGSEALEQWRREPAEVLLCDLAMPGVDGFDVVKQVKAWDAEAGRRTYAVALTAHVSADVIHRTLDAGFDAHVPKPFDAERLIAQIADAVVGG